MNTLGAHFLLNMSTNKSDIVKKNEVHIVRKLLTLKSLEKELFGILPAGPTPLSVSLYVCFSLSFGGFYPLLSLSLSLSLSHQQ